MDELIIGDKKYISSKRAAKETGYAKDYVGQLCREGRVPARLVGRSWYVLESAIQDHRFKDHDISVESVRVRIAEEASLPSRTSESPRYEAESMEAFPSAGDRRESATVAEDGLSDAQNPHEAWKAWFDRFKDTDGSESIVEARTGDAQENAPVPQNDTETNVPLRVNRYYPPKELLPEKRGLDEGGGSEETMVAQTLEDGFMTRLWLIIRASSVIIVLVLLIFAVIGSGIVDDILVSSGKFGSITGISIYNR